MEAGIVLIGIATVMNSVVLAWFVAKSLTRPIKNLPLPIIPEWESAADKWTDWIVDEPQPEPAPAAVTISENSSPWKNQTNIQQGSSAPAPPIVKETLPPLARPAGFV